MTLDLHEITFPDGEASAGRARRLAMDRAARSSALSHSPTHDGALANSSWPASAATIRAATVAGGVPSRISVS